MFAKSARPEDAIQRAVFEHLQVRGAPGLVAWHTPNAGWRSKREAAIFAGLGVRPGVSDIVGVHAGKVYALELKAEGGRATEAQLQFLAEMEAAGAVAAIADDLDNALVTLERWGRC